MKVKSESEALSRVRLFATPWTAAYEAPPSMGFSRQEDWSGVPLPSPVGFLVVTNIPEDVNNWGNLDEGCMGPLYCVRNFSVTLK